MFMCVFHQVFVCVCLLAVIMLLGGQCVEVRCIFRDANTNPPWPALSGVVLLIV